MKQKGILVGVVVLVAVAVSVFYLREGNQECDALFVQSAQSMAYDGRTLTLSGLDPNIIFFCDRPERIAGHLTMDAFMELVSEGENSFADNPPNAALSIFGDDNEVTEVVLALLNRPRITGDTIAFDDVDVLDGELPASGDAVVLFIDPIGRPMSPTSAAGVHRRHRRHAERRHD